LKAADARSAAQVARVSPQDLQKPEKQASVDTTLCGKLPLRTCLGLSDQEEYDLVEYLKSL